MKKILTLFLSAAVAATAAVGFAACKPKTDVPPATSPRDDATVTIFTTNDMHGNLVGDEEATIGVV